MNEKINKITPTDLHDISAVKHDAALELDRGEAFIAELVRDILVLKLRAKGDAEIGLNQETLTTLHVVAKKAHDHLLNALRMVESIPKSFGDAYQLTVSGDNYTSEDIFGQDEDETGI